MRCHADSGQTLWLSLGPDLYLSVSRLGDGLASTLDRGREAADRGGEPKRLSSGFVDGASVRHLSIVADDVAAAVPSTSFHIVARGSALVMLLFEKDGQHQALNRQSQRYARGGVELSLSTLADQVGACTAVLKPLYEAVRGHCVRRRLHLRRRYAGTGAGAVRDANRPSMDLRARGPAVHRAGAAGVGVLLLARSPRRASRTPSAELRRHPPGRGLCWAGVARPWSSKRHPGLMAGGTSSSWPTRRCARGIADCARGKRIDAVFAVEREINGHPAETRLTACQQRIRC